MRFLTCSVVMTGESGGRTNTARPFTVQVGGGASIPLRTRSETAPPRLRLLTAAYSLMIAAASSSILSVVRTIAMVSSVHFDLNLRQRASVFNEYDGTYFRLVAVISTWILLLLPTSSEEKIVVGTPGVISTSAFHLN